MTTHTTPDDQPLTPTPDTTRDITELWDAMGEAGIRPNCIELAPDDHYELTGHRFCYFIVMNVTHVHIEDEHAADILTGHAERWLRGRGWYPDMQFGCYSINTLAFQRFDLTLPAAIRHEQNRGSRD